MTKPKNRDPMMLWGVALLVLTGCGALQPEPQSARDACEVVLTEAEYLDMRTGITVARDAGVTAGTVVSNYAVICNSAPEPQDCNHCVIAVVREVYDLD